MKLISGLLLLTFLSFPYFINSQSVMEFAEAKAMGDQKTVYFQIKGLDEDEMERASLLEKLLADENILDGRIFTSSSFKTRCQLYLPLDIKPDYIRAILNENGYDFEFSSITVDGYTMNPLAPTTFRSGFYYPSKDFPKPLITGDKKADSETYQKDKEAWISQNEKKYNKEKSVGTAVFPIEIPKSQFDSFSDEKKQRVLAEPKKYVIK
jgi:hypothetical protein